MSDRKEDKQFMGAAIEEAKIAEENGDVPIGAIIVYKNQVIGKAYMYAVPTAPAPITTTLF